MFKTNNYIAYQDNLIPSKDKNPDPVKIKPDYHVTFFLLRIHYRRGFGPYQFISWLDPQSYCKRITVYRISGKTGYNLIFKPNFISSIINTNFILLQYMYSSQTKSNIRPDTDFGISVRIPDINTAGYPGHTNLLPRTPGPPNFFLSLQAQQMPQSSILHLEQSRHGSSFILRFPVA